MDVPENSDLLVIRLAEHRHKRFSHSRDRSDGGAGESPPAELLVVGILEETEKPKLFPLRALGSDLEVAGHLSVHCFPPAPSGEARRRSLSDGLERCQYLRLYIGRTIVEEIACRY